MWLCFNDAFLSVVNDGSEDGLLVRSRRKGDVSRVFPGVVEKETPGRDYRYRAYVPRDRVAQIVADRIMNIDYDNFKDSVFDTDLHNAYARVWGVMGTLQPGGPYGRKG